MRVDTIGTNENREVDSDAASKVLLMDQIIQHFLPLFKKEVQEKKNAYESHNSDILKLKQEIGKTRKEFISLKEQIKKEGLIRSVLDECVQLYASDVLYGTNKKIVLDVIDNLREFSLQELQLKQKLLRSIVYKNVKKVRVQN